MTISISAADHNNIEAKLTEADLYAKQGLTDEALTIYETLLSLVDASQPILRDQIEERLVALHSDFSNSPNQGGPGKKSTEISEADHLENALGLMVAGFYAEAHEELTGLVETGFRPAAVHSKIGECCLQLDKPFEAIEHFEAAVKESGLNRREERLQLLDSLAVTYERTGSIALTIKILEQIINLDPDFRHARQRLNTLTQTATKYGRFYSLIRNKLLSADQLEEAKNRAKQHNKTVDNVLLTEFGIEKQQLGQSLSEYYECPFVEFIEADAPEPPACIQGVKENYFRTNAFIPIQKSNHRLLVLADNPNDLGKQDNIRSILHGSDFLIGVALREDINKFIDYFYGKYTTETDKEDVFEELELLEIVEEEEDDNDIRGAADGVVVQMANKIIEDAVSLNASDIHIESLPGKKGTSVRFRVDGACNHYKNIPHTYKKPLVSRLKILAKLDISERRLPQDGKIKFKTKRGKIELRVATLPTHGGNEDVVLRILAGGGALPLDKMGLSEQNLKELRRLLELPYGLMLVVGPTGSGKTTTLHGALNYVNRPDKKIWTVEDPVEIVQDGLRQVQVEGKIGLDFAKVLRAFLRADPDIIMVGETRDEETAATVIEAALTGHLVFSTLHTNTAPETITRLLGMGIDPFNFSDSLLGVLAQRLVKRLCNHCKEAYQPNDEEKQFIISEFGHHPISPLPMAEIDKATLYRPIGCGKCKKSGYQGRLAIHELLTATDPLKLLIVKNSPIAEIREEAMRAGMHTLKQDGILKVINGETDLLQVRAACIK
ncbi:MAG: ATPase, T2SS/T4P/T4SS family [Desulfobulbaceae bacterium]|nr:ATPase, T2SS/T4P/T4SS family [Desulfobulbaceae bacterium]HIJ79868.1 Flp pilus assembly complex ATPase component TadA [Deltaproteobacteria bacterium]